MAAAVHDVQAEAHTEGASNVGLSGYVITSGAQKLLVGVMVDSASDETPVTCSSSIDGALTALPSGEVIGTANSQHIKVFYKDNPTVGTHTFTGVWTISTTGGVQAVTIDGITSALADVTTSSGSAASISNTVPNVVTGDFVLDFIAVNGNPTITPNGSQTQLVNASTGTSGGTMFGMSSRPGSAGGTMSWTWTGSQRTASVAFRFPGGGAAAPAQSLAMRGVGS